MVRARMFVSVAVVLSVLGPATAFGQQPAAAAPPAAPQTSTPTTRLTAGIEQASLVGRTSATYWLVDFFLDGPLGNPKKKDTDAASIFAKDPEARFYDSTRVWLNARLSGGPATADSKLTSYVGGLDLASAAFKPQELARSVQLSAGLQFPLATVEMDSVSLNGKRHDFHVAFIVGGGVESPVYDATAPVPIYEINDAARAQFPAIAPTHTKLAFVQADRSRYYHRWLAGLRLRTYAYEEVVVAGTTKKKWIGFPGQLDFTIGQSEVLSGGSLNGLVMNAEGFYVLPLASSAVYMFGAVAVHLTEDDGEVPRLLLKAAGEAAAITDADVYVHYVGTPHRDLWKIGVAVDLLKLFTKK